MSIEERMAALRARFIERAAEERAAISAATGTTLDRKTLFRRAHAIAGSAGLFGFGAVGDDASAVEDAIDADAPDEEVRRLAAALEAALAALS